MDKDTKKILVNGIAILSAFALKKVAEKLIEKSTEDGIPDEPENPSNNQTWPQAIAYAAISGAAIGVFRLIAERTANQQLEKIYD
ncbi:DUF4235 domain-containing protein [Acidiluteibacter ferrifornacis]|uniref:DUF4235 domain-containing protein n=1 Tax=Acidiluteibacter ferrifornacis TaxID=2692424 RepID=A0A6N9NJ94_9FLAO|nr:DUF4235 domain-containing protein [Acidiluteibacter ferrifornacis]NBG65551.1 DUF4235 domain-containing protein [Acidiluteibacter ferrifornacis]|tara:strand:+ start:168 stop:422 length:255 start_codon:yes stop_codon:yes gene_type:complete